MIDSGRGPRHTGRSGSLVLTATLGTLVLAIPEPAWGAPAEPHGRFGPVLFGLAVLVVAAKLGGLLAERLGQPSVLGELLVGIGLGNLLPLVFGQRGVAFFQG